MDVKQANKLRSGNIPSSHPLPQRLGRLLWGVVWLLLFRPSPKPCYAWRRWLIRRFGARIGGRARLSPNCRIWAPWNLTMGDLSCLGDHVDCYCVAPVTIGSRVTVSQYSYLCAATHSYTDPMLKLIPQPIVIHDWVWVCADVFVGPGVTVGEGAVIGARSSVYQDVPAWKVCVGNPAKPIKSRVIQDATE